MRMRAFFLGLFAVAAISQTAMAQVEGVGPKLIPLETEVGRAMLRECESDRASIALLVRFETQVKPAYCSVASSVMCLSPVWQ